MASTLKRLLVGRPIASTEEHNQRIGKPVALAVFASDAISSTAYATEEILLVLMTAVAFPKSHSYLVPIGIAAVVLLVIVLTSYRQTIHAYPNGGGAYVVSKENISPMAGLVAGASLLVDYTLTVAVSISSGVLAIASAVPALRPEELPHRALPRLPRPDDGRQPARPEGGGQGLRRPDLRVRRAAVLAARRRPHPGVRLRPRSDRAAPRLADEFAKEHAAGHERRRCSCSCGPSRRARSCCRASRPSPTACPPSASPSRRTRRPTLTYMGAHPRRRLPRASAILAHHLLPVVDEGGETVLSQMGKAVFGETPIYYVFQIATFAILILAANTAFAGFPQLSSIIARDGYLPRQLANRGDRLAFSNGILVLSGMAARADRRLPGRGQRADPALRGGRVHRVHAVPVRHVPPPPARCASRSGSGAW